MNPDVRKLLDMLEETVDGIDDEARIKLLPIITGFVNDLKRDIGRVMKLKADKRLRDLEMSLDLKYRKKISNIKLSDIPEEVVAEIRQMCELELASKYRELEIQSANITGAGEKPVSETGPKVEETLDDAADAQNSSDASSATQGQVVAAPVEKRSFSKVKHNLRLCRAKRASSESSPTDEELPVLMPIEPVELYFRSQAFRAMMEHCIDIGKRELEALGFLLGDHFTHEGDVYTVVEEVVTSELDSSIISVKIKDFTPMFERMHEIEKAGKDFILVGWYHSHPGHTCFLSPTDVDTQKRMFRKDYHAAVVVDPVNSEVKSFKLGKGEDYREISYGVYR
ncbi:MAG: Mov34/MPN/PAD-1 family protein [Candidatus Thermoplasmatota archaeon]|jgi:proteasome lid subunit RPN8/RPN11|nr:Mov34/MPN/PAD-1 family protein [Candidatus Thermoplasmatota archaeon]MDP7264934.1 Mov34/MPN/PAD-1 family protein [Candidatus Thermoplasmatota archaeon]